MKPLCMAPAALVAALFLSPGAAARDFPSKDPGVTRIALIGCHQQDRPAPALALYPKTDPDLVIWVGDNVYADTTDDPSHIERCLAVLEAKPGFRELRDLAPFAVTWDDHDYGLNNSGRHYAHKRASADIFRRFWRLEEQIPAERDGIYHAQLHDFGGKRLHVVLLDVRYNRDDPGPEADMLGEAQWQWLAEELKTPSDLRLIVSGTQILVEPESGWETWTQYPRSLERLVELLRRSQCERTLFITGDQHYAEVGRAPGMLDFDLVEVMFAGINQIEDAAVHPLRVSPVQKSLDSVGFIDVQWEQSATEVSHVVFRAFDASTLQQEITYRVNLHELELDLRVEGLREFCDEGTATIASGEKGLLARYTLDGSVPGPSSPIADGPIRMTDTTTIRAALFHPDGWPRGEIREATFSRVEPIAALPEPGGLKPGLRASLFEGAWKQLPDFARLRPVATGVAPVPTPRPMDAPVDGYGLLFEGLVSVPATGMVQFQVLSDDGTRLFIDGRRVVENDGSHSPRLRSGWIPLAEGLHALRLEYFEDHGGEELQVLWQLPGDEVEPVPAAAFQHR